MLPHWLCLSLSAPQYLMTLKAAQDWMHRGIGKQAIRTSFPFGAERKFHAGFCNTHHQLLAENKTTDVIIEKLAWLLLCAKACLVVDWHLLLRHPAGTSPVLMRHVCYTAHSQPGKYCKGIEIDAIDADSSQRQ